MFEQLKYNYIALTAYKTHGIFFYSEATNR